MSQRLERQPTETEFETLLKWLDPDLTKAAEKYLLIGRKLQQYFTNRQCFDAEHLADRTINRVIQKLPEIMDDYVGEPMNFIHRVAHFIFLEYQKESKSSPTIWPDPVEPNEEQLQCLEKCLRDFSPDEAELLLTYYRHEGQAKIHWHDKMAAKLGIEIGALRNRVFRLRRKLYPCVLKCWENLA